MPKDPLCLLGFHPQVRWPTRCKRCFREYKEHISKKDEVTDREVETANRRRLESSKSEEVTTTSKDFSSPYSSLSSAALARLNKHREDSKQAPVLQEWKTFTAADSLLIPPDASSNLRRNTTDLSQLLESEGSSGVSSAGPSINLSQAPYESASFTVRLKKSSSFNLEEEREFSVSPSPPPRSKTPTPAPTFQVSDESTLPQPKTLGKSGGSRLSKDGGTTKPILPPDLPDDSVVSKLKKPKKKRLLIQGVQEVIPQSSQDDLEALDTAGTDDSSADVAFIIQVKSTRKKKKEEDDETMSMTTTTDTTETTLVDVNESQSFANGISLVEHEEVKKEVERLREKCDKLEKEKGEILSRRVSNLEAPKAQSAEYLKLQQRVNQLMTVNEDLKDEQRHLESKVRELENDLASRPTSDLLQRTISELRSKVANAEADAEKLQEEKRDVLRKMNDMQDEFEEMQDNFREEQSEEFATVKRELDEASKNCRLLQFKLRKVEKKSDQLEAEKKELEIRIDSLSTGKIAKLEEELAKTKVENEKLLRDSFKDKDKSKKLEVSPKLPLKKKSPVLTKAPSGEKVDPEIPENVDPAQLLRDLQSTLERESDMREQLKFAEEEINNMRQKISRIEDENESVLMQIKKMSTKPKLSNSTNATGKADTGADKVDVGELKIQLDLNEQESKILRRKVEELEVKNNKLTKELSAAEDKLQNLDHSTITKSKSVDEVSVLRRKIIEKEREIERVQAELQTLKTTKPKTIRAKSVDIDEAAKRQEKESKAELKKMQEELLKHKEEAASTVNQLGAELAKYKLDAEAHENRSLQLGESNKTLLGHIEKFKRDIATMKEHYEAIQDDFVVKNSQLQTAKEDGMMAYKTLKKDYDTIDKELKALRETFNNRQDTWIKEKLNLQDKLKEIEQVSKKTIPSDESGRLKSVLKEQTNELETRRREINTYKDQIVYMQQENDELRKQLEDFEKLSQAKMSRISNEPSEKSDREIKAIREKLFIEEKSHKNEVAQMKLRHEQQIALQAEEISTVHSQLSRAKRERDTFRQMVDSAQRAIAELKSRNSDTLTRRDSVSGLEEAATGARAAVISLQERIASLEDELTEARREASRAKTEIVTEKSAWEMKIGDLQQKINELEEDRLMGSGRARAAGQRTRLELAWQKEREEQQRRLKETTTLARDLKTTLLEIERERDREKTEGRRRLEQTKVALEEEQEEMRRKVSESHCDLLELRDAHAKLRTANEKLRRDRERLEKDKDMQTKKELEVRKVLSDREKLLDELVTRLSPMAVSSQPTQLSAKLNLGEILNSLLTIKGIREPEGMTNAKEARRSNFRRTASAEEPVVEEVISKPKVISISSTAYGKEHYGTAGNVGRAAMKYTGASSSTLTLPSQGRTTSTDIPSSRTIKASPTVKDPYNSKGSLYRKSLSLEQTVAMPDEQKIWKGDSDAGSAASLKSQNSMDSRGSSMDRFSTISSKSEKPKSKSLVGKVKKFVKSKSIEESSTTAERVVRAGVQAAGIASNSGSISSLGSDTESKKESSGKRLKDKVKGIFRRSSRSPSAERSKTPAQPPQPPQRPSRESTPKRDSTQRPLMPTESLVRPLMPTSR